MRDVVLEFQNNSLYSFLELTLISYWESQIIFIAKFSIFQYVFTFFFWSEIVIVNLYIVTVDITSKF